MATKKLGRPPKSSRVDDMELTDTSRFSNSELKKKLRDQIFTQAMLPDPQSTILVLATKVFGLDSDTDDEPEVKMSTKEILDKLAKIAPHTLEKMSDEVIVDVSNQNNENVLEIEQPLE